MSLEIWCAVHLNPPSSSHAQPLPQAPRHGSAQLAFGRRPKPVQRQRKREGLSRSVHGRSIWEEREERLRRSVYGRSFWEEREERLSRSVYGRSSLPASTDDHGVYGRAERPGLWRKEQASLHFRGRKNKVAERWRHVDGQLAVPELSIRGDIGCFPEVTVWQASQGHGPRRCHRQRCP